MRKLAILELSQQQRLRHKTRRKTRNATQVEEKRMATTIAVFAAYLITALIITLAFGLVAAEIVLGAGMIALVTVGAYHALGAIMALAE